MMWKILMARIMEYIYDLLISRELFPNNKKDSTSRAEVQEGYYILINTSSRRARRDRKTYGVN